MNKSFFVITAVLVAALIGIFVFTKDKTETTSGQNVTSSVLADSLKSRSVGAGNKKVEIVEYGDFQCPACAGTYPTVKAIKAKYGDDITFVFKHFPLSIHQNAKSAHRAAEAAARQGKFFEMHDLLYEQQVAWQDSSEPSAIFRGYAEQLGLDMTKYDADFASEEVASVINADMDEGAGKGVDSTPTFYINGEKIEDNRDINSVDLMSAYIDNLIKNQSSETTETTN